MTDVTAIIFVIACSSFNMVIREDEKTVSYDTCMEGCAGYNASHEHSCILDHCHILPKIFSLTPLFEPQVQALVPCL